MANRAPRSRFETGTVRRLHWDSYFWSWRVEVVFDRPAGTYYGQPIKGVDAFPDAVHVIGSDERPFSDMTPAEIDALAEQRRQAFWRNIDPRSGLSDPSGVVPPRS